MSEREKGELYLKHASKRKLNELISSFSSVLVCGLSMNYE